MTRLIILLILFALVSFSPEQKVTSHWISLFNGKDLTGWKVKIRGHSFNENFGNTFRVADGKLQVSYDQYEKFNEQFGHIFYNQKFSSYLLSVEYRFIGNQANEGPGWATRNSGAMMPAIKTSIDSAGGQYGLRAGGEGTPWSFATHFTGRIVSANTQTRAATVTIDIDGDGKGDATLQLGPVIRGTALRDTLPFVSFSNFADQIEFASFSRALNDRTYKGVLEALPRDGLPGREVSGRGAFTMRSPSDEILITPVELELGPAP